MDWALLTPVVDAELVLSSAQCRCSMSAYFAQVGSKNRQMNA